VHKKRLGRKVHIGSLLSRDDPEKKVVRIHKGNKQTERSGEEKSTRRERIRYNLHNDKRGWRGGGGKKQPSKYPPSRMRQSAKLEKGSCSIRGKKSKVRESSLGGGHQAETALKHLSRKAEGKARRAIGQENNGGQMAGFEMLGRLSKAPGVGKKG